MIAIIRIVTVVDNWGKEDVDKRPEDILRNLQTPEEWSDDSIYYDENRNQYWIEDLIGKEVKVGNTIITVKDVE